MQRQSIAGEADILSDVARALLQNVLVLGRAAELSTKPQVTQAIQDAKRERAKLLHDLSAHMWRQGVSAIDQTTGLTEAILEKFQSEKAPIDATVAGAVSSNESSIRNLLEHALSITTVSAHIHNFLRTLASRSEHAGANLAFALSLDTAAQSDIPKAIDDDHGDIAPLHVLLVEDNASVAVVTEAMLIDLGWRVTRMPDAASALTALSLGGVDLLLSDVMMPGQLDGFDLALRARGLFPTLRVVLSSGYVERIRQRADAAGIPLLAKPYRMNELAFALDAARPTRA